MFNIKKIIFFIKSYTNKLLNNLNINSIYFFYKLFLLYFIINVFYIYNFNQKLLFKISYIYNIYFCKLFNNKKKICKLSLIKKHLENNEYFIKINKNFSEIFIKLNINKENLIKLFNEFPKLYFIKKGDTLNINLFNNRNIKKIIWNISHKEKNIYDFFNGHFREIKVRKINNLYFFILKIKIGKNFFSNAILSGINKNDILSIIEIINNYTNFNKINYNNKCIILLNACDNPCIKNYLYKPILIKFSIKNKNYYIIRKKNGNFYFLSYLEKYRFIRFPVKNKYRITSKFNLNRLNPVTNKVSPHRGVDIAVPVGTPVFSSEKGIIKITSFDKHGGKYIIINHNNLYYTKYMHLKKILVNKGQVVNKGEWIGLSGNSGRSTGPHLHFELWINNKAVNPIFKNFLYSKSKYVINKNM